MAWQEYPVSLRTWKKWMSTSRGTTFRVGRNFKGPMPVTPELLGVLCEHGIPRDATYAIPNGWLEGAWIDRRHNYQAACCTDKDLGEWVTIVSIDGVPWWLRLARWSRKVFAQ
jgi:hypothetical protein